MTFFETLLLLLTIAVGLLPLAHRLSIPYPTMLAAAGVVLALVPNMPAIHLDPATALALFIAPALCDAAYEFPAGTVRRLWRPLIAFAVIAVVLSTAAVAWIGVAVAGLSLFAAIALGAIVAPPDAVAATAILGTVRMPRRTVSILKGESLLNDATALLLFTAAVSLQSHGTSDGALALKLGLAVPGGLVLGVVLAGLLKYLLRFFEGMLSGYLLEYLASFAAWIVAEHLGLSAVLCVVAFAMTLARSTSLSTAPRVRLHTAAVSHTSVLLLNVLAFLLMGIQAQTIVSAMSADRLRQAAWFAGAVIACVVVVRIAWVLVYNGLARRFDTLRGEGPASTLRQDLLLGWCGMRGLVTLAAAIALPTAFPQRDLIVLTAFAVVLATLVLQGLSLAPLVRLLGLDGEDGLAAELAAARADLISTALAALSGEKGAVADHWRLEFGLAQSSPGTKRSLGLRALARERERLEALYLEQQVGPEAYAILQEDLDFAEVALSSECDKRLEEG